MGDPSAGQTTPPGDGPAAAAAAAASKPIPGKADVVTYVVLDLTDEGAIGRIPGHFSGKTREDAVAAAIEQTDSLKAKAAETELALLPISKRLYDSAVKVKAETVPAKTELRFRT